MNVASHRTAVSHMNVHQFEVNVFGAVAMIKAVLPSMRARISIPSSNGSVAGLPLKSQCVDSDIELHRGSGR
jgi:NAD(P)-dependent dehydrogenase (short-subunit alcohol dehydrogenase family)